VVLDGGKEVRAPPFTKRQSLMKNRKPKRANGPDGPLVIGWKEYVDFVDWGIRRVKVKIDTGARTSALDVTSYELRQADGPGLVAELRLALDRRHPDRLTVVQTPVLQMVVISNSSGIREQRPLVETAVRLGPVVKRVRLTVTNRAGMLFRMIVGRKALEGDFVVDVSRKYLLGRR
jgi:hypothetical protein